MGKYEGKRLAGKKPAAKSDAARQSRRKNAGRKAGKIAAFIALGLVVLAAVGVYGCGAYLKKADTIYPNVFVANVNVGGLRRDAAVVAVEEGAQTTYTSDTLTVVLPDRSIALDPEITQLALNADEAVDAAMLHGREGGPIACLLAYLRAGKTEFSVDLESSLKLDTEYIRHLIDQTARDVESDRIEPSVDVDETAGTITVRTGSSAVSLDADALYDAVLARFSAGDFSDLHFDYISTPCSSVALDSYYEKYCKEAADAYYDEEEQKLVAEETGYGFDLAYYQQKLDMAQDGQTVVIQMEEKQPKVTLEELQKIYFADTLAKLDTVHTNDASRTKNLDLACKSINGTILNPGEIFSFNDIVGERTKERGYLGAIVYTEAGKSEAQDGGGVCQVASTIYSCCLMSGLEVVERAPHMYTVTYVELGMDATIYWGQLDFKFKNSTEYPLRIDASVSGGYVHIALVGTEPEHPDYDHIKLRGVTVSTKEWKNVIVEGEVPGKTELTLSYGGGVDQNGNPIDIGVDSAGNKYILKSIKVTPYTGKTVQAYLDYCDKDGKVLNSKLIHTDTYLSRDKAYEVEPYVEPEPEEPEEPEEPVEPEDPFEQPDETDTGPDDSGDTGGDAGDDSNVWW